MKDNIRLVQLIHPEMGRKIAIVSEPNLVLLHGPASVYELAVHVIDSEKSFYSIIENSVSDFKLEYDPIYKGSSDWKLLPSFNCPASC